MKNRSEGNERIISVRLSDYEAAVLEAKAKEANMSKSMFIKNALQYGGAYDVRNFTRNDARLLRHELDQISNNLGQIEYRANSEDEFLENDIRSLCHYYYELISAFYKFVNH